MRLPTPCLLILVGPSGAGKSTWAAEQFRADQIVSADALRSVVGEGPGDLAATADAFELLDLAVDRRLARSLTTVIDSLGLDVGRRRAWRDLAARHGVPCHAVTFPTPARECRARNRSRPHPVPAGALTQQLGAFRRTAALLDGEGFDGVHQAGAVEVVRPQLVPAADLADRQRKDPTSLAFGLHLPRFTFSHSPAATPATLADIGRRAEAAGFAGLWVMDHFLQIPQAGRPWEDMLESWSTLGYLAALTERVELGTLVTGITYRNPAHLAKIAATVDVLSGGRVVCGVGAAWYEREHVAYGWEFPPLAERFELLEDALRLLPVMWGPGSPAFEGRRIRVPETACYPRPVRGTIPILVGGSGERRTLRLVARYADRCNLFGNPATVRAKVTVLAGHCHEVDRDPAGVEVTHLSTALVADSRRALEEAVDGLRPGHLSPDRFATAVNAATVPDQIGRFRELAEAGVATAIVSLPDVHRPGSLEAFGQVIAAFG